MANPSRSDVSPEDREWLKWFHKRIQRHVHRPCTLCLAKPYRPCTNLNMSAGLPSSRKNSRAPSRSRYRQYVHAGRKRDAL